MVLVTEPPRLQLVQWVAEVREKAVGLPWEQYETEAEFGAFSVRLNEAETGWLLERNTTEAVLLAAFCVALSEWTGRNTQWVKVGRLPMLIDMQGEENPAAILKRVGEQVQRVRDNEELRELAGMEEVLAKYAVPTPEVKLHVGDGALTEPHRYPLELRAEWIEGQLFIRLHFAKSALSEVTAGWLAERFQAALQELIRA
ncbi:hypothetical protein CBW65_11065 [Tumebacillus avium]|uniref:Condensation domain-containing protein n=1 Tax=Tumebacillus avium TaxID=1903704 RepID=A0A1Y0IPU8_9BACL|nr:hypothetical protein [Tumebacillus avium]ARU61485.1 hypothetical protein CBW65_11065 [Tumebacillus avium]